MRNLFKPRITITVDGHPLETVGLDDAHILWPDCRITKLKGFEVLPGENIHDAITRITPDGCTVFPTYDMAHAARVQRPGWLLGVIKDVGYLIRRRPHVFLFQTVAGSLVVFAILASIFAFFMKLDFGFVAYAVMLYFLFQVLFSLIDTFVLSPIGRAIKRLWIERQEKKRER